MDVLPRADEKAVTVRTMFDRIAPSYDRMNRIITLGFDQRWRRSLIDRLAVGSDDTVLDLACGTGDFATMARARGARVVGLDFAGAMLSAARERCPSGVALVRGDALTLPLTSGSVSVAVSGFALRNFVAIPRCWRSWRACCAREGAWGCWKSTNRARRYFASGTGSTSGASCRPSARC